jgi:hypothetical protein
VDISSPDSDCDFIKPGAISTLSCSMSAVHVSPSALYSLTAQMTAWIIIVSKKTSRLPCRFSNMNMYAQHLHLCRHPTLLSPGISNSANSAPAPSNSALSKWNSAFPQHLRCQDVVPLTEVSALSGLSFRRICSEYLSCLLDAHLSMTRCD